MLYTMLGMLAGAVGREPYLEVCGQQCQVYLSCTSSQQAHSQTLRMWYILYISTAICSWLLNCVHALAH